MNSSNPPEARLNGSADKSAFFDRWSEPQDAVFIHPFKGTFQGKSNWLASEKKNSDHKGCAILHLKDFI